MTGIDWSGCVEEIPDEPARPAAANGHDTARPLLAPAAYHGLASEVVARILPNTESDSSALLLQFLVYFGNAVGRGPHYLIEQTQHFANLFVALVGQTSKSRKGTSAQRIRVIFNVADPAWASERILGGMSSGEGLIYAVRDPVYAMKKGVMELIDEGVSDKRLLLDEREFFQSLAVLKREGNTLSRVVRDAWDCCEHIGTLTKHSPTHASQPYISIAAHITVDELRQALDHTSMANGYANRYLFALVHRSKLLPHGSTQDAVITDLLGERTLEALTGARHRARHHDRIRRTALGRDLHGIGRGRARSPRRHHQPGRGADHPAGAGPGALSGPTSSNEKVRLLIQSPRRRARAACQEFGGRAPSRS